MQKRINDHQRVTMLLATNDVRNLRRIISVALRNGASIPALLTLMQRSIDGKYSPRGSFSEREYAIGFLAKSLGGPRLLYALSKGDKYPSISTVAQKYRIPRIIPSVSVPSRQEISDNITMFFGTGGKQGPNMSDPSMPLPGHILMIDGVALNEVCRYDACRNSILGLCREHAHNVNTYVTSLDVVKNVELAIHEDDKKCCYGKDATVVAIGPYANTTHYTPVPIVVSPSCKKESGNDLAQWIHTVLRTWETHPDGQAKHGPIWVVGSDGESSFRLMRMKMCMTRAVDANSDLGCILHKMPGLNTRTGENGIVGTCDPKHVIKRGLIF
jgi:hypothetical protein